MKTFTQWGIATSFYNAPSDYSADEICFFADCINGLPRKILGYHTPEELFNRQLDRIYAA